MNRGTDSTYSKYTEVHELTLLPLKFVLIYFYQGQSKLKKSKDFTHLDARGSSKMEAAHSKEGKRTSELCLTVHKHRAAKTSHERAVAMIDK